MEEIGKVVFLNKEKFSSKSFKRFYQNMLWLQRNASKSEERLAIYNTFIKSGNVLVSTDGFKIAAWRAVEQGEHENYKASLVEEKVSHILEEIPDGIWYFNKLTSTTVILAKIVSVKYPDVGAIIKPIAEGKNAQLDNAGSKSYKNKVAKATLNPVLLSDIFSVKDLFSTAHFIHDKYKTIICLCETGEHTNEEFVPYNHFVVLMGMSIDRRDGTLGHAYLSDAEEKLDLFWSKQ